MRGFERTRPVRNPGSIESVLWNHPGVGGVEAAAAHLGYDKNELEEYLQKYAGKGGGWVVYRFLKERAKGTHKEKAFDERFKQWTEGKKGEVGS